MSDAAPKKKASLLGQRGHVTDEMAQSVWRNIAAHVSKADVEHKALKTIREIQARMKGHDPCVAWSGGKDSLVVEHLAMRAGILGHRILGITAELEYPAMEEWYATAGNLPDGTTIDRAPLTYAWLSKHEDLLFPKTSKAKRRWWTWQDSQQRYAVRSGRDVIILGRRIQDQNFCGRDGLYESRGVIRYSPIRDWTHEETLAYIHYHGLPVPPCYSWFNGFAEGTHPWPDRSHTQSVADGWAQVYSIDPSIVLKASSFLASARDYLAHPTPIATAKLPAVGKTHRAKP